MSVFLVTISDNKANSYHNYDQNIVQFQSKSIAQSNNLYEQLENLLSQQKYQEADKKTLEIMLAVVDQSSLDIESIKDFPCLHLRAIDRLWVKYSNGKFGFSVQKKIYQSLGDLEKYDYEILKAFGGKVGWRKGGEWLYYNYLTFNLDTPDAGHLPRLWGWWSQYEQWEWWWVLFDRAEICGL